MKHQPTGGRGGVDVLGQGPKTCALRLDRVHDVEKVTQGTGEAVILGSAPAQCKILRSHERFQVS